jgi:GT2 family glycosyltransferase
VTVKVVGPRVEGKVELPSSVAVIDDPGCGPAAAIQRGWESLSEDVDIVGWLGDDDRLAPHAVWNATNALHADPSAVMVYGRARYLTEEGRPYREIRPGRLGGYLLGWGRNLIAQPGSLYRRTAVDAVGGLNNGLRLAFDVDLHARLRRVGRLRYIPCLLGEVRTHPGSLTVNQPHDSVREAQEVLFELMPSKRAVTRPIWDPFVWQIVRAASKVSSRSF